MTRITGRMVVVLWILTVAFGIVGCADNPPPPTPSATTAPTAAQSISLAATPTAAALSPLVLSPLAPATGANIPVYTYKVINTYPHDPTAWTQGLLFDNGALYEGTGLLGQSVLRKIDWETGEVQQEHKLTADYYGEGITIFGEKLYQLTWQTQIGFVYDKATFALLQTFTYPTQG
ncbi:MAG: glutaminyl-peptide cyclotransferase, partial [Chloroflexota bacterium]|nr:glutaminyl-peptide cyclotransferase [Chloroflexota bacterium]